VNPDSLAAFAFILLLLVLGKLTAWRGWLPDSAADTLNWVVLNLCLPAAVLLHVPGLTLDAQVLAVAAVPWLLLMLSVILVLGASHLFAWPREVRAALLVTVPLGNTSFLGYPLIAALLGSAALPYAVIYDQLGAFLILSSFGLFVLAWYGGGERPRLRDVALRVLKFPPFIALLLALFLPESYPAAVSGALERLSGALLPLVVLAIGLKLRLRLPRERVAPLAYGLALKLMVLPAAAWWIAPWLGLADLAFAAVVLESAMPPMITAAALVAAARLAPELATAMAGYGIVVGMATLAFWSWLLR
jgi:predicted permease